MRISIMTLGCKLNQAESEEIKRLLRKQGHVIVPFNKPADIAIIRACAVTMNASQTTRELIRQAKRRGSFVIAAGCIENRDLPEIDLVAKTPKSIVDAVAEIGMYVTAHTKSDVNESADRTRALIKIQTGCNFNCAYCVIPSYRGRSQSISSKDVIKDINHAVAEGYKEIVLTGVNICQYAEGELDLAGLIALVLKKTKIKRIRLGSLDPRLISARFIRLFTDQRLMPHWHLSLQSGSDAVLKRMRRGYTVSNFWSIITRLRKVNPLFSFTTDIIVGFPGETEEEFLETLKIVKRIKFTKVHVFQYSPRPGTLASGMKGRVQDRIIKQRASKLISRSGLAAKQFITSFVGKTVSVLFEKKRNGNWIGYAPAYFPVKIKSAKNLRNKIVRIKLTKNNLKNSA